MIKIFSSLVFVSILFIGLFSRCSEGQPATAVAPDPPTLPVTTVEARDTVIYRSYVADVQAVRNVELRARVPGFLEKIYVDEGQPVKHRQRLFKISEEEYAAELAKAKANLQSAIAQAKASQLEVDRTAGAGR